MAEEPRKNPNEFVRIETEQGKFSVSRAYAESLGDGAKILDGEDATNHRGKPLPHEPKSSKTAKKAASSGASS